MRKWLLALVTLVLLTLAAFLLRFPESEQGSVAPTKQPTPEAEQPELRTARSAPPGAADSGQRVGEGTSTSPTHRALTALVGDPASNSTPKTSQGKQQSPLTNRERIAELAKASGLQGRVVDPRGLPVSGARVALRRGKIELAVRHTDKAGRFAWHEQHNASDRRASPETAELLELRVTRPPPKLSPTEKDPSSLRAMLRLRISPPHSGEIRELGDLLLPGLVTLTGIVLDTQGQPLRGISLEIGPAPFGTGLTKAKVAPITGTVSGTEESYLKAAELWSRGRFRSSIRSASARTDGAGRFRFSRVPAGLVLLTCQAGSGGTPIRGLATLLRVGATEGGLRIVMEPLRRLSILVTDRSDRPIAGALASVFFPQDLFDEGVDIEDLRPYRARWRTDNEGRIRVQQQLRSRIAEIRISAPGFVSTGLLQVPTQLEASRETRIQLTRGLLVRGKVVCRCAFDPKGKPHKVTKLWLALLRLGPSGEPLEGTRIRFAVEADKESRSGEFMIRAPEPGRYWLRIEESSHESIERQIVVGSGETLLTPFDFGALGSLSVEVGEGLPVGWLSLKIEPRRGHYRFNRERSPGHIPNGACRFNKLVHGLGRVRISGQLGVNPRPVGFVDPLELAAGPKRVRAIRALAGPLRGRVLTATGEASALALVQVYRKGFPKPVATISCDAEGRFQGGWLIVGRYRLVAEAASGRASRDWFTLGRQAKELSPLVLESS